METLITFIFFILGVLTLHGFANKILSQCGIPRQNLIPSRILLSILFLFGVYITLHLQQECNVWNRLGIRSFIHSTIRNNTDFYSIIYVKQRTDIEQLVEEHNICYNLGIFNMAYHTRASR